MNSDSDVHGMQFSRTHVQRRTSEVTLNQSWSAQVSGTMCRVPEVGVQMAVAVGEVSARQDTKFVSHSVASTFKGSVETHRCHQ